jgi:hypothetical protein
MVAGAVLWAVKHRRDELIDHTATAAWAAMGCALVSLLIDLVRTNA